MSLLSPVINLVDSLVNPVYNNLGAQIGYYDTLANLANANITYNGKAGVSLTPPSTWVIKTLTGEVNAGQYLLAHGYTPSWASDADVAAAAANATPSDYGTGFNIDFSNIFPNLTTDLTNTASKVGTYAVIGGFALAALLIVTRRRT